VTEKKIRAMVAKPGLDGHDRGAKIIAHALRDAGMEVIYTGLRQTPEQIVNAALQEDIDVLLLSILSGAHNHLFTAIMKGLQEKDMSRILVMGGGVIPQEDIPNLKKAGISEVFGPGTSTETIIAYIKDNLPS
jgi:methylmalonyl-CoA mutase C-terminal domain/subunit